jgi:hypothetical protein
VFVPVGQSERAFAYSWLEVQRCLSTVWACPAILRKDVGLLFRNA